ncbi:MAG: hypothetical protein IJ258_00950 [Methanobrevibacter sp.]|uniref:hypothetical protein n=1 Tax=Methanobrevibacter sp. TaxID=66852 RepID=UPI0025F9BF5F|nr:hypothetical protein [Methanobrevibacter sp.]MBQ8016651.1 hypothetical protein [Methanobrevibacter sp.]
MALNLFNVHLKAFKMKYPFCNSSLTYGSKYLNKKYFKFNNSSPLKPTGSINKYLNNQN